MTSSKSQGLKSLLDKIPSAQKFNWDNGLIPYYLARLKEWNGGQLADSVEKNRQYANLLMKNKILQEFALLKICPFKQDFAMALEWILAAGDAVPENKKQMTNFFFIYKNFEKIMKKIPCSKTKK